MTIAVLIIRERGPGIIIRPKASNLSFPIKTPKKQESAGGSNSQVDPSLYKFCRSNQHMQKDCIGFLKWLNKKGIIYYYY